MPESDPNKHPSRRLRALKPSGYEPESYEEFYGADEQAELFDIMQGVRPEDRFSGEFGILPYLGYYGSGDPEDPAYGVSSINKYDVKHPEDRSETKLSSTWEDPDKLMRSPKSSMLGFFNPLDLPLEYTGLSGEIQYLEGSEYPSPGASGISAFYPQEDFLPLTPEEQSNRVYMSGSPFLSSQEVRTGKVDLGEGSPREAYVGNRAFPGVAVHELMHRGFNTEAVKDFSKEYGLDPSNVMANDFFVDPRTGEIDPYFQHIMIDSRDIADSMYSEAKDNSVISEPYQNILETFQDQFLEWLTPEKQAKYGIDLPDAENLGFLGLQGGGPVYMANGGEYPAWATPGINPNPIDVMDVLNRRGVQAANLAQAQANAENALKYQWYGGWLPQVGANTSVGDLWETLAPEPGTMGSEYSIWIMENIIMEALEGMQSTAAWDADQISAFQDRIYDNLLAAAENEPDNAQLQGIATNINTLRGVETPTELTADEKWEAWDEYLAAYEPSGDDNADIADAAEKAMEIFGKESDEAKEAFLVAAATAGVTTEQIAQATGTTESSILDNLPEISPIDYAKEAVTAVVGALKTADGSCIVGLGGSVTCDFTWGGQPPFGTGQQTGVPIAKIPGTNTTVGVDLGSDLYNLVFGIEV